MSDPTKAAAKNEAVTSEFDAWYKKHPEYDAALGADRGMVRAAADWLEEKDRAKAEARSYLAPDENPTTAGTEAPSDASPVRPIKGPAAPVPKPNYAAVPLGIEAPPPPYDPTHPLPPTAPPAPDTPQGISVRPAAPSPPQVPNPTPGAPRMPDGNAPAVGDQDIQNYLQVQHQPGTGVTGSMTLKGEHRVYTPEEQAQLAQEARDAGVKTQAYEHAIEVLGRNQYDIALKRQAGYDAAAESAKAAAVEADNHRRDAAQEMARRSAEAAKARDSFTDLTKDAPIGSVLNPNTGQKIAGALALMFGGFVQGVRGGSNPGLEIINSGIHNELAKRRARLEAGKEAVDATDKLFQQSREALGSWDAAQAHAQGILLGAQADRAEGLKVLAGGQRDSDNADVAVTGLRSAAADSLAKAHALTAGAVQTDMYKRQLGGGGGDSLAAQKKIADIQNTRMDVLLKTDKFRRGAENAGVDPKRVQYIQRQMEHAGIPKYDAAQAVLEKAIAANGGKLPDAVTRKFAGLDRSNPGFMQTFANETWSTPAEREAARALIGYTSAAVYADSGAQINTSEFTTKLSELGLNNWSDKAGIRLAMKRTAAKVDSRRHAVAAGDAAAFSLYEAVRKRLDEQGGAGAYQLPGKAVGEE